MAADQAERRAPSPRPRPRASSPLALVVDLCGTLSDRGVRFCHWKSNEAIDLSASGDNDLDLLVDRADADQFGEVAHHLGFKPARPEAAREVPGLNDSYGLDVSTGRLVHLQAHYQLVLGDDMTKNFRLPVEAAYLASRRTDGLFPLPAPDFELALFVVRMVLKHASWDAQVSLQGRLSDSEQRELADLFGQVAASDRVAALVDHLPFLSPPLAESCLRFVEPGMSRPARAKVARALEQGLVTYSRRPRALDVVVRTGRRGARLTAHVVGHKARKQLVAGGSLIGVVGADHAATGALADGLVEWLGSAFRVRRFDVGGPAGSREARRSYAAARRFATNGDIAVCHQIPLAPPTGPAADPDVDAADVLLDLGGPDVDAAAPSPTDRLDGTRPAPEVLAAARPRVWASL